MLVAAGIDESRITCSIQEGGRNSASDIISVAEQRCAGTLVRGKHGADDANTYAIGNVVRKVIENADNLAVWVVP